MDPGGAGALIGIGTMLCVVISMKLREVYLKRKKNLTTKTPLLPTQKPQVKVLKNHWKMNKLLKPLSTKRLVSLSNLSSAGSRNLPANLKI